MDLLRASVPLWFTLGFPSRSDAAPRWFHLFRFSLSSMPSRTSLIVAFAAIYLIWGSTYLGIRLAVEAMPPFLLAGARFIIAGALLFAFLKLRGAPWPTAQQWRINAIIGTILLVGGNGLVVWAPQFVPSGITALLLGVGPLFIVLTEWAWPGGLRPSAVTLGALLLGFGGVTWLAAPWERSAEGGLHAGGVAAMLAACIFWAIGSIYSRHARHGAGAKSERAVVQHEKVGDRGGACCPAGVVGDGDPKGIAQRA